MWGFPQMFFQENVGACAPAAVHHVMHRFIKQITSKSSLHRNIWRTVAMMRYIWGVVISALRMRNVQPIQTLKEYINIDGDQWFLQNVEQICTTVWFPNPINKLSSTLTLWFGWVVLGCMPRYVLVDKALAPTLLNQLIETWTALGSRTTYFRR